MHRPPALAAAALAIALALTLLTPGSTFADAGSGKVTPADLVLFKNYFLMSCTVG